MTRIKRILFWASFIIRAAYYTAGLVWLQYRLNLHLRNAHEWDNREEHAHVRWAYAVITAQEDNRLGVAKSGVPAGSP